MEAILRKAYNDIKANSRAGEHQELLEMIEKEIGTEESKSHPLYVSAKDLKNHIDGFGISGSNKSKIEAKFTEVSKEHGMILVIKSNTLPSEAMHEEVDLKGRVLIASQITDNKEMIEQHLIDLNMIDDFNDYKSKRVIELAIDLLSHHGKLEIS